MSADDVADSSKCEFIASPSSRRGLVTSGLHLRPYAGPAEIATRSQIDAAASSTEFMQPVNDMRRDSQSSACGAAHPEKRGHISLNSPPRSSVNLSHIEASDNNSLGSVMASCAGVTSVCGLEAESETPRRSVKITFKRDRLNAARLAVRHLSMDPREASATPVAKLDSEDLKNLVLNTCQWTSRDSWEVWSLTATIGLAAGLRASTTPVDAPQTLGIHEDELSKIKLSLENELRGLKVMINKATDFVYRVNVHNHLTKRSDKGTTTTKMLYSDHSGSKIVIQGARRTSSNTACLRLNSRASKSMVLVNLRYRCS
ncbi:hypothetical protein DOTSEDRAFT_29807 [Dothistroma septosporum NZE10]|uniref:Uncharacterized protein n=1 Tax=Dothistroma septosporum (strain NZE10 / CBS 128990) TaxID=675120 RepID=N1PXT6_DOTSN|nr:hypothetical protein DOTSEDRAFT_29807 [Dothistroma septosporum NZE10]